MAVRGLYQEPLVGRAPIDLNVCDPFHVVVGRVSEDEPEVIPAVDPRRPSPGMRDRVARALFATSAEPTPPVLGRYRILGELGRGGMGVVVRAYDPKLRREVALKLLRVDRLGSNAQARMIREARAMARLSHPNVVGVHDVELDEDGGVVVVMEHVDGQTLDAWLRAEPRPWQAILPPFIAAGRGLAAAHAAGLLHRDFKPSNVLLGTDGRARVADFGLARACTDETVPSTPTHAEERSRPAGQASQLTTSGALVGTPDFMAPEQLRGEDASARSDQYAFCVALWWALTGALPFPTGADHERATLQGPTAPSARARVPRGLVAALRRGLAPEPGDRWPSMDALLEALTRTTRRRRGPATLAVGTAGLVLAVAVWPTPAPVTGCDGAAQLEAAWGEARQQAVRRALLGSEAPHAARAFERTQARLDAFAADWTAMAEQACHTAMGATGAVSLEPVPTMRCLRRSQDELEATVARLAEPGSLDRVDALLGGLPALARCREATDPPPRLAPAPHEAQAVEDVLRRLATAGSLRRAGRGQAALDELEQARAMADRLSYAPVHTALSLEHGDVMIELGRFADAEVSYAQAQEQGARFEQWHEVAMAIRGQISVVGSSLGRPHEAILLADLARGFAARSTDRSDLALTIATIAQVRITLGEYAAAERELSEALAIWTELHGDEDSVSVQLRSLRANARLMQGRLVEAEREVRAALTLATSLWGPRHPRIAGLRGTLGSIVHEQGRLDEAEREQRAALELAIEVLPADHPQIAALHSNLATTLGKTDRLEESEQHLQRALEIYERSGMGRTPHAAGLHGNLAVGHSMRGELAAAERALRAAVSILEEAAGPEHPSVGRERGKLGDALVGLGRLDEAEEELQAALRINTAALGPDHTTVGLAHQSLAVLHRERGNDLEALAERRAAVAILGRAHEPDHLRVVWSRMGLGEQLVELGRHDEAETELRAALDAVVDSLPPEHWTIVRLRVGLGLVALARGQVAEARAILERQWSASSSGSLEHAQVRGRAALALVRALGSDRAQRARATAIAKEALADAPAMIHAGPRHRRALQQWLAAHG